MIKSAASWCSVAFAAAQRLIDANKINVFHVKI